MLAIFRVMGAGGFAIVAALGLAVPASAEPLSGSYTATIGDRATMTQTWVFTPCGADCTTLDIGGGAPPKEMRLQGNSWTWTQASDGVPCTTTVDAASLVGTTGCGGMTFPVRLSR